MVFVVEVAVAVVVAVAVAVAVAAAATAEEKENEGAARPKHAQTAVRAGTPCEWPCKMPKMPRIWRCLRTIFAALLTPTRSICRYSDVIYVYMYTYIHIYIYILHPKP